MDKRNKTIGRLYLAVGILLASAVVFAAGWLSRWFALGDKTRSLIWAIDATNDYFYEDAEEKLYDRLFDALSLDPYSAYYPKQDYSDVVSSNAGNALGTGLSLWSGSSTPRIYSVTGNSPAEHAGIRAGMTVYAYGESGETLVPVQDRNELTSFVGKQEDTFYLRCGFSEERAETYAVTPAAFRMSYCLYRDSEAAFRFDPAALTEKIDVGEGLPELGEKTAYIRLERFYGTAAEEFRACLTAMRERGRTDLVIDLRGNGGGSLAVFCEIVSHLMRDAEGRAPVAPLARYRNGSEKYFYADGNDFNSYFTAQSEVYVLADMNTASASECLIGALVSYNTLDRSHIFLRKNTENDVARTYGKGIMQTTYTDLAGNALKLTTARVYWPDEKTSIHGVGVTENDGAFGFAASALPGETDKLLLYALENR